MIVLPLILLIIGIIALILHIQLEGNRIEKDARDVAALVEKHYRGKK